MHKEDNLPLNNKNYTTNNNLRGTTLTSSTSKTGAGSRMVYNFGILPIVQFWHLGLLT